MKMLFVVTAFYPEQAVGAIRVTRMVKHAVRSGHEVTVLSLPPPPWAMRDDSLWFSELEVIRWMAVPQSTLFLQSFQRARVATVGNRSAAKLSGSRDVRTMFAAVRSAAQLAYTILKAIDWVIQVRRHAIGVLCGERFDAIVTSYPSLASPFAGVMLKCMHRTRCLVIDFRDPISYGRTGIFSVARLIEKWLLARAALVSCASDGIRAKLLHGLSGRLPATRVVPNGFDGDDVHQIEPTNVGDPHTLHFAYVGSLYGGKRDLSPFFRALMKAMQPLVAQKSHVVLHYAGPEGDIFRAQAARHGLAASVREHGRITRARSLGLQRAVDICLLSTWNTSDDQGILTGKLFEFLMLRKPIVAVVNGNLPGSEIRQIITDINAGFCYEESIDHDMPAFVAWLQARLHEKAVTGRVISAYHPCVTEYDFRVACGGLFQSVEEVFHSHAPRTCEA